MIQKETDQSQSLEKMGGIGLSWEGSIIATTSLFSAPSKEKHLQEEGRVQVETSHSLENIGWKLVS